jgi:hypothetical protein
VQDLVQIMSRRERQFADPNGGVNSNPHFVFLERVHGAAKF